MKRFAPLTLAFSFLLLLGACGSDAKVASSTSPKATTATTEASSDASSSATTAAPSSGGGTVVEIKSSTLGKIVTDGSGHTLYMFTPDSATMSACTAGCATAWPPAKGPATTGSGVDADDLGTVTRSDGTTQATFYGHPLYTYAGDSAPGDVTGQGSGGKWYVLDASGNPVMSSGSASSATTTSDDDSGY